MQLVSALIAGLLFGLGLVVSGMVNPLKVQNFLDLFGTWDPSLAFVMAGAILVALPGFRLIRRRPAPLFAARFRMPTRTDIDGRLVAGAAVFGLGWGLAGYCPGPVLTALRSAPPGTLVFVPAMFVGIILARLTRPREGRLAAAAR